MFLLVAQNKTSSFEVSTLLLGGRLWGDGEPLTGISSHSLPNCPQRGLEPPLLGACIQACGRHPRQAEKARGVNALLTCGPGLHTPVSCPGLALCLLSPEGS